MTAAMKARDELRLSVLRGALSSFTNELIAKGKKPTDQLTDEEALAVLRRQEKQRHDAAEQFEKGGRAESAEKEKEEARIIQEYLPAAATREDIEVVVKKKIEELGITDKKDMGKLMGSVMQEFKGRADGNDVKDVVNALLS